MSLCYNAGMRLFIAVKLNDQMIKALEKMQSSMRNQGVRGSFTRRENLHVTLAFIGEYSDPDHVLDVMDTVAFAPFDITLEGAGHFGDLWWAGLGRSDALNSYARQLRHSLADSGIPFDRKKFSPHITLVRRASVVVQPEMIVPRVHMTVEHISLFRSDRGKSGMIYTELGYASAN